ncbi:M20 family metallopeptidase [Cetobacterium sp.]|uniref:M20 family metallopeptidase n=1 Tax=Cetobacterium sp. TaxID=2071632 RepID=UPI003EE78330
MSIENLKKQIKQNYLKNKDFFNEVCLDIFINPELGLKEILASGLFCEILSDRGFKVQKGIEEFDTAFIAECNLGKGPTIAFIAEYDSLPELGHACGHNIIGTSSVAAAIILKELMETEGLEGTIKVIGTPAEENLGAKANLIEYGIFKDIDYAMMLHPADASMYQDISFACTHLEYNFKGAPAHSAAAPWKGKSALNGIIQLFNASNAMRLHLKDHCRLHGIITEGGTVDNIIPEKATAVFNIRALDLNYLNEMVQMMEECALGAAQITGTTVEIKQVGNLYKEVKNSKKLEDIFKENFDFIGEKTIERNLTQGIGSTDMGNVTQELEAIHAYIKLDDNAITHTKEFAELCGSEKGLIALEKATLVLAMSGLDLILD